jgi:hypothetical protein
MRPRVNSPRRAAGRAACGGWRGGDGGGGAGGCRGVTGGGGGGAAGGCRGVTGGGGGAAGGCRGVTGGGGGAAGGGTAAPTEGALRGARHLAQNLALGRLGVPHFGQVIVAIVLSFLMIFSTDGAPRSIVDGGFATLYWHIQLRSQTANL